MTQVHWVWLLQDSIYTLIPFSPRTCCLGCFTQGHNFYYVLSGYKCLICYRQPRPLSAYDSGFLFSFASPSPSVSGKLWSSYALPHAEKSHLHPSSGISWKQPSHWDHSPFIKVLIAQLCPTRCDTWTTARQALLSMGFSRREYWSGLLFPSAGDLPNPGIESGSPALQEDPLPSETPGKWTFVHGDSLYLTNDWSI